MATILETAASVGVFNTLLAAVDAAGLREALESPGPFTVMAPVDDAFAALPPGTVQTLVDNPPQLARILKYHVIAGLLKREDLITQEAWNSLEGAPIQSAVRILLRSRTPRLLLPMWCATTELST